MGQHEWQCGQNYYNPQKFSPYTQEHRMCVTGDDKKVINQCNTMQTVKLQEAKTATWPTFVTLMPRDDL